MNIRYKLMVLFGGVLPLLAYPGTNNSCFFRIVADGDPRITDFDANSGVIQWSNSVAVVTNLVQRAYNLNNSSDWSDYVRVVSSSITTSSKIMDLRPPEDMVFIPAGINTGTNPLTSGERYDSRYPKLYSFEVAPFFIDTTEVTKAEWDSVAYWAMIHRRSYDIARSTATAKGNDHPVQRMNWYQCVKWCNAKSEMFGRTPCYTVNGQVYRFGELTPDCNFEANGYRLPTDAEWEYAARGALIGHRFPWGDTISHSNANTYASSYASDVSPTKGFHPTYAVGGQPYTSPVASFAPNGYGVYDMAGNATEWCWDLRPPSGRSLRGGGWNTSGAINARCGSLYSGGPGTIFVAAGFRTVCQ